MLLAQSADVKGQHPDIDWREAAFPMRHLTPASEEDGGVHRLGIAAIDPILIG
jgi:hypothetical protein